MADGCPEHVWELRDVVVADAGLSQRYECGRCPAVLDVAPGEAPPHSPDLPAG